VPAKDKASYTDYVKKKPKAPPAAEPQGLSAYLPAPSAEKEADFMASLLGDVSALGAAPAPAPRRARKRKDQYRLSDDEDAPPARRANGHAYRDAHDGSSSDGLEFAHEPFGGGGASSGDDLDLMRSPRKKARTTNDALAAGAAAKMGALGVQSDGDGDEYASSFDDADFMDVDVDAAAFAPVKAEPREAKLPKPVMPTKPVNGAAKKEESGPPAWLAVYDGLAVAAPDDALGGATKAGTPAGGTVSALEDDGSLRFFWLDVYEHAGKLYFVGKVRERGTGAWASACVTVENLQRNLFVLPRERRVEDVRDAGSDDEAEDAMDEDAEDEDEDAKEAREARARKRKEKRSARAPRIVETDEVPSQADVYADFDQVRRRAGIKKFRAKFVPRRYAFGEREVPRDERPWLKVVYGFDGAPRAPPGLDTCADAGRPAEPQIPNNVSSPNFSRVFGTSTNAFELLVLKRKIMGPCWLQIKKPLVEHKGVRSRPANTPT
jgi:DNA polymerase alpha subunit A